MLFWVPVKLIIDPRGKFTHIRCSAINVVDTVACFFAPEKLTEQTPQAQKFFMHRFANICEFLANYP